MNLPVAKRLKNLLAQGFVASGGFAGRRRRNAGRLLVVYYHRVVAEGGMIDANLPGMYVREGAFAEQIRLLTERYNPIAEEALLRACRQGEPLPEYPVLITFDDGYRDNLTLAAPILAHYRVPWLLFATTGFIDHELWPWFDTLFLLCQGCEALVVNGRTVRCARLATAGGREVHRRLFRQLAAYPEKERQAWLAAVLKENRVDRRALGAGLFCSWEELAALGPAVAIGGHTTSHPFLSRLTPEQATAEIVVSRERLATRLGRTIETFAYPTGRPEDYSAETIAILKQNRFACAFTTSYGLNAVPGPAAEGLFTLKRIGIDYYDTIATFKMKITGSWSWFAGRH